MTDADMGPLTCEPTLEDVAGTDPLLDKIAGALVGAAIADALGWPTEFMKSKEHLHRLYGIEHLDSYIPWPKITGGRFNAYTDYIQPGEYSDDTQLALCTARSILQDGTCDMEYFSKVELGHWLDYARGAGATVTAAARAISRQRAAWNDNFFRFRAGRGYLDYRNAGANGAAMRIAPIVMANVTDHARAATEILRNAVATHGHPRAVLGALVYGAALGYVLTDEKKDFVNFLSVLRDFVGAIEVTRVRDSLDGWVDKWDQGDPGAFGRAWETTKEETLRMLKIASRSREVPASEILKELGCFQRETKGSGTATVVAAIALFLRYGGRVRKAITTAANMVGTDTDTIAAMVGGLSGATCGYTELPEPWAAQLQDLSYFLRVSEALHRISRRAGKGPELRYESRSFEEKKAPDIMKLLRGLQVKQGQRVCHPVLGPGWVQAADMQEIRRRGGGRMIFTVVAFDMGQKCKFRCHVPSSSRRETAVRPVRP